MRVDLGTLAIDKLIVHEVPSRRVRDTGGEPILSEVESGLTTELRNYFSEKIKESLLQAPYEVVFAPPPRSPVPDLVLDQFGSKKNSFVQASQEMAQHLHSAQTGVNPAGLLIAVKGKASTKPCFVIVKLEREEGMRAHQGDANGKLTFNLEHIRDLFLSNKTRVFKVGLFVHHDGKLKDIEGQVSDHQRGYQPKTEVADFFLKQFLGCELKKAPEVITRHFLETAESFLNDSVEDAAQKAKYNIALNAELTSNATIVRPRRFAEEHLDLEHRQVFLDRVHEAGLPTQQFDKDTATIEPRLKRMQIDFESGLALIGPPDTVDDKVQMERLDGGATRVEFTDRVKEVRNKR